MSNWQTLVSDLEAIPELTGARCRGRHELFDATVTGGRGVQPEDLEYAREKAVQLCAHCPALHDCATWLSSLPPSRRPLGVIAGRLNH